MLPGRSLKDLICKMSSLKDKEASEVLSAIEPYLDPALCPERDDVKSTADLIRAVGVTNAAGQWYQLPSAPPEDSSIIASLLANPKQLDDDRRPPPCVH